VIIGNTISQNGADVEDTATSGTAGINIHSLAPVNGTVISQNLISQEAIAIAFTAPSGEVTATLNNFTALTGIFNGGGGSLNAPQNWWGCLGGPQSPTCAVATGPVVFTPWLTGPFASSSLPAAPTGGGGSPPPSTGITIVITGPGAVTSATNTFQVSSSGIVLDASKSTSSNPGALSYSWTIARGYPAIAIPGGNSATPTIQLPQAGTYQLILTVTDSTGATATATVTLLYS
jgi:hypothetical protein